MSPSSPPPSAVTHHAADATAANAEAAVSAVIEAHKTELAEVFYVAMRGDADARELLAAAVVEQHLKPSMARWMSALFSLAPETRDAVMAQQRHVGEVHARADIPINLVARGTRVLKREIKQRMLAAGLERAVAEAALLHVDHRIDLAFEEMSAAFVRSHDRGLRADEAFRLFAAGQNLAAERERQLAAVLDWENQLFRVVATGPGPCPMRPLTASSFGLWLHHKAPLIFHEGADLRAIEDSVERIDDTLLPQLPTREGAVVDDAARAVLRELGHEVAQIRFLLAEMFDRLSLLDVGRDPLTHVFNRRFLPSVLRRETELFRRRRVAHAVLMVDIDHFKRINDVYGHEGGDRALQQVAALLLGGVRSGDFVFRYGGEEFLVVLTEVEPQHAAKVAEKIRATIAAAKLPVEQDRSMQVTVSIGGAISDGHPDYEHLIQRADRALYEAKARGRNVCVFAPLAQVVA